MPSLIDLTGKRFGRLTVQERGPDRYYGDTHKVTWRCVCDCGEHHLVTANLLRMGKTTSCGCYQDELSSEKLKRGRQTRAYTSFTEQRQCRECGRAFTAGRIEQYCSGKCWRVSRTRKRREQRHKVSP